MNQEEKGSLIAKLEEIADDTHPNQDELRNRIQVVIWDIQELDHIPEVHPEPTGPDVQCTKIHSHTKRCLQ